MSHRSHGQHHGQDDNHYDVAIIGAGIAGMATAARLQAKGLSTIVLESHSKIGGCAGYFRRKGFSFDVGATTLVDFEKGGVGGELLDAIHMPQLEGDSLPGYVAWLPDRTATLHRDSALWARERLVCLGDSPAHQQFWTLIDQLAAVFWRASRNGIKLPMHTLGDMLQNVRAIGLENTLLARYLFWTVGDALRHFGLRDDKPLCGLLSMLIEDTVHSTLDAAPLINAALGVTIRGAGLMRHHGGMHGFWEAFAAHYKSIGGDLRMLHLVYAVNGSHGDYHLKAATGVGEPNIFHAHQIVSALPAALTAQIAPADVRDALQPYLKRDEHAMGGAVVVFLGVPEDEISGQPFTHHQLLQTYDAPLGNGNNMFISVSAQGDTLSAPDGCRAVMISTHCDLSDWNHTTDEEYQTYKCALADRLIHYARRVYPRLGECPQVYEVATPRTYEKFTLRPNGAVGGVRQTRWNSNQFAVPHDIGVKGFWLAGDTTFPGLGTVACVLGSRIVESHVLRSA